MKLSSYVPDNDKKEHKLNIANIPKSPGTIGLDQVAGATSTTANKFANISKFNFSSSSSSDMNGNNKATSGDQSSQQTIFSFTKVRS